MLPRLTLSPRVQSALLAGYWLSFGLMIVTSAVYLAAFGTIALVSGHLVATRQSGIAPLGAGAILFLICTAGAGALLPISWPL
jgi:hypothetical protein